MAKAVRRKANDNGYKMPETLPQGEVLKDMNGKEWRLGQAIGKGGFGEIYSAQEAAKGGTKYPYVVKIEPHENGPLFVEMHFYMRNAKRQDVEKFINEHKLKTLGMPVFIGFGSHMFNQQRYRFIVIEKYGLDIDKLLAEHGGAFSKALTFQLAWQMSYVLQYIHQCGYVHADLKGANILLGSTPATKDQAYLLDFGLACTYNNEGKFTPNPKKAHDGTPEYLSRDAHLGVYTPRGDLEILAYNLVVWLGGKLPWINDVKDLDMVQKKKEEAFANLKQFLQYSFEGKPAPPASVKKLFDYVKKLKFNEPIDYDYIRAVFEAEVETAGSSVSCLDLSLKKLKRKSSSVVVSPLKRKRTNLRQHVRDKDVTPAGDATAAATRPAPAKKTAAASTKVAPKANGAAQNGGDQMSTEGFTPAMLEVLRKRQAKQLKSGADKSSKKGASDSSSKENKRQTGRRKGVA